MIRVRFIALFLPLLQSGVMYGQWSKSLLWKVESQGKRTGYLYGSIHLPDSTLTQWPASVWKCFNESDVVAGELDLTKTGDIMSIAQLLIMKDSMLHQLYSNASDFQYVKSELKGRLDPMLFFMVDRVKPFFTLTMLNEQEMLPGIESDKENISSVPDYRIQQWAVKAQKKVIGLETFEEQMSAIDAISCRDQAAMLLDALRNKEDNSRKNADIINLYKEQDITALLLLLEEDESNELIKESIIENRNKIMAHRLDKLLEEASVFAVIGAGHLAGEKGMIREMENAGYKLTPLIFEFQH
ncbi:MAG: TraB/GumN family protein [Crocinitomicaceae bacterium]|nr:TraB/GumN family protein [Crocinitomicaceae bacterium]